MTFSGAGEAPPSARAGELTSRSTPPLPLTAELVRQLSGLVSGSPCLRRPRRFALGTRPATCRTGSAALPPLLLPEKDEPFPRRGFSFDIFIQVLEISLEIEYNIQWRNKNPYQKFGSLL